MSWRTKGRSTVNQPSRRESGGRIFGAAPRGDFHAGRNSSRAGGGEPVDDERQRTASHNGRSGARQPHAVSRALRAPAASARSESRLRFATHGSPSSSGPSLRTLLTSGEAGRNSSTSSAAGISIRLSASGSAARGFIQSSASRSVRITGIRSCTAAIVELAAQVRIVKVVSLSRPHEKRVELFGGLRRTHRRHDCKKARKVDGISFARDLEKRMMLGCERLAVNGRSRLRRAIRHTLDERRENWAPEARATLNGNPRAHPRRPPPPPRPRVMQSDLLSLREPSVDDNR